MILQKRLSKDGHEVVSVNDGVESVRAIEEDSAGFDLILMDLLMPVSQSLDAMSASLQC
jgi:CheY-like chemotaxis protein